MTKIPIVSLASLCCVHVHALVSSVLCMHACVCMCVCACAHARVCVCVCVCVSVVHTCVLREPGRSLWLPICPHDTVCDEDFVVVMISATSLQYCVGSSALHTYKRRIAGLRTNCPCQRRPWYRRTSRVSAKCLLRNLFMLFRKRERTELLVVSVTTAAHKSQEERCLFARR